MCTKHVVIYFKNVFLPHETVKASLCCLSHWTF